MVNQEVLKHTVKKIKNKKMWSFYLFVFRCHSRIVTTARVCCPGEHGGFHWNKSLLNSFSRLWKNVTQREGVTEVFLIPFERRRRCLWRSQITRLLQRRPAPHGNDNEKQNTRSAERLPVENASRFSAMEGTQLSELSREKKSDYPETRTRPYF